MGGWHQNAQRRQRRAHAAVTKWPADDYQDDITVWNLDVDVRFPYPLGIKFMYNPPTRASTMLWRSETLCQQHLPTLRRDFRHIQGAPIADSLPALVAVHGEVHAVSGNASTTWTNHSLSASDVQRLV